MVPSPQHEFSVPYLQNNRNFILIIIVSTSLLNGVSTFQREILWNMLSKQSFQERDKEKILKEIIHGQKTGTLRNDK